MTKETAPRQWIPLDEAARLIGTTAMHLLMMIKRGLIRGREKDGEWLVAFTDLESGLPCRESVLASPACHKKSGCGGCGA